VNRRPSPRDQSSEDKSGQCLFRSTERSMRATSANAAEPSFFYLVMAKSCFRRAVSTPHPKAGGTLRELGRNYLAKAGGHASHEPRASATRY
jgi:hypothetical protein